MLSQYAVVRDRKDINSNYKFCKLHDIYLNAKNEAERLCRQENDTFYVIQVVGKCYQEEKPVKWEFPENNYTEEYRKEA